MGKPVQPSGMSRGFYVVFGIFIFLLGVASRVVHFDSLLWSKYLGDALYAVMFYLCLAAIWPEEWKKNRIMSRILATAAFIVCVECFQLTGIPLAMRQSENLVAKLMSIVLGTKFGWGDMLAYFVGIAAIGSVDAWLAMRTA